LYQASIEDYRPKCFKCDSEEFIAIPHARVENATKPIALVVCKNPNCQTVIGVLPANAVWSQPPENEFGGAASSTFNVIIPDNWPKD
jgi:hypothetical protein